MDKKLGAVTGRLGIVREIPAPSLCMADQCDDFGRGHGAGVIDFLCSG